MNSLPADQPAGNKDGLHPRNRHRGRYDLPALASTLPELAGFLTTTPRGEESIDFANPAAVKTLNIALLKHFYHVSLWDIPAGYLAPPIPGRADYLHYLADLLADTNGGTIPTGKRVRVLDVGVGANCIYPIIGHHEYGWRFVGSDVDPAAVRVAKQIAAGNPSLAGAVDVRLQPSATDIFTGIIRPGELFDLTMCNPPFHTSAAEAAATARRKTQNLGTASSGTAVANFGGQANELWYPGGEATFTWRMAEDSARHRSNCLWFSTLISKKETLPGLYKTLQKQGAADVRTIGMSQGQKISRLVAWTFLDAAGQQQWRERRWPVQG